MPRTRPPDGESPSRLQRLGRGAALGWLAIAGSQAAFAYGPQGHLIAGQVAEPLLCARAATGVAELAGGQDLGEIGLWADRIRSQPEYADSAPWHYMNIPDDVPLQDFVHPPEGDVLWAIAHFSRRLGNATLRAGERAEALRFLVHFIVDIHQPLHVGLAQDRGGNAIRLEFHGEATNLHRFWDTHAVEASGRSVPEYVRALRRSVETMSRPVSLDPVDWAAESRSLRRQVYGFGRQGREPPASYVDFAAATTADRLALAALRLAGTLNAVFCK